MIVRVKGCSSVLARLTGNHPGVLMPQSSPLSTHNSKVLKAQCFGIFQVIWICLRYWNYIFIIPLWVSLALTSSFTPLENVKFPPFFCLLSIFFLVLGMVSQSYMYCNFPVNLKWPIYCIYFNANSYFVFVVTEYRPGMKLFYENLTHGQWLWQRQRLQAVTLKETDEIGPKWAD